MYEIMIYFNTLVVVSIMTVSQTVYISSQYMLFQCSGNFVNNNGFWDSIYFFTNYANYVFTLYFHTPFCYCKSEVEINTKHESFYTINKCEIGK